MRTTIRLDDRLHAQARYLARESGRTLSAMIETALQEYLARAPGSRVVVLTDAGNGLQPGVRLDNSSSLLDLMDGVTPENLHEEIDFGPPVGREVW
jgi:antitoxin MazE